MYCSSQSRQINTFNISWRHELEYLAKRNSAQRNTMCNFYGEVLKLSQYGTDWPGLNLYCFLLHMDG